MPDSGVAFNAVFHLAWGDIAVDNQGRIAREGPAVTGSLTGSCD